MNESSSFYNFIVIYLIVQAILGILLFEWAYSKTDRHRTFNKERDEKFHSYRRLDAGKWGRFNMYPGAILVMPTRLLLCIITLSIMAILAS